MKITGRHIFIGDNCRSHRVKVAAICFRLEPVPIYALLWVIIAGCILVGARACVCICTFVCECLCVCVYVFVHMQSYHCLSSTRLPLLFCFVSFHFPPLLAGNKHWLSVSSLRSSFRSRGSGGWANVVQGCQALFRKLGFCFVPLLNRSCFFFFPLVTNKALVLSPLFFLPFVFLYGTT